MNSAGINKIATTGLLAVMAIAFGRQEKLPLDGYIEGEMQINGAYPKVGEVFEIVYRVKIKESADWTQRESYLQKDYAAVINVTPVSYSGEVIGQNKFYFSGLTPGETKEFRVNCRITTTRDQSNVLGQVILMYQGKERGYVGGIAGVELYLIDPETGQLVSRETIEAEYESIVYRYEAATFGFMTGPDPAVAEVNRKVIVMMRKMEPTLSDSEALLLHSDIALVGASPGCHIRKFEEGMLPGEEYEEFYKYYLENGWLKAVREGKHEDWIIEMKNSHKRE